MSNVYFVGVTVGNMCETEISGANDPSPPADYEQTSVNVFVKMVICRKYTTDRIDGRTGLVISSEARMVG